jgi:transporter family protein
MVNSAGWFYWALLSAILAALTAIFAKVGIQELIPIWPP